MTLPISCIDFCFPKFMPKIPPPLMLVVAKRCETLHHYDAADERLQSCKGNSRDVNHPDGRFLLCGDMASIEKRISKSGERTYHIMVCAGYGLDSKKVRRRTTYKPDANMSDKQADKAAQKEAFRFER